MAFIRSRNRNLFKKKNINHNVKYEQRILCKIIVKFHFFSRFLNKLITCFSPYKLYINRIQPRGTLVICFATKPVNVVSTERKCNDCEGVYHKFFFSNF